jgi:SSS family solute:Na+ symporter
MAALALQPVALAVFLALFVLVTVLGFLGAKWRRGDLDTLHEWGLGGRRFGTLISWFLLGGDLYTAYTFVAVPALVYGAGAVGFFAVPYTIIIYPILFSFFPRLWRICKRHGYLTAPEFVRGRFDSRALSLAVAITGILATMPYIALQLVGMQVVLAALGLQGAGIWSDVPLFIAFIVLAAFTYTSGLRAPAIIAVVKDLLIYATVIAAAIVIPMHLGGWSKIFATVPAAKLTLPVPGSGSLGSYSAYATLALGSALALFLYPHSMTGILAASSGRVLKRNAALLPAYSLVLGLLALLGFMAIAYGVAKNPAYAAGFAHLSQLEFKACCRIVRCSVRRPKRVLNPG